MTLFVIKQSKLKGKCTSAYFKLKLKVKKFKELNWEGRFTSIGEFCLRALLFKNPIKFLSFLTKQAVVNSS